MKKINAKQIMDLNAQYILINIKLPGKNEISVRTLTFVMFFDKTPKPQSIKEKNLINRSPPKRPVAEEKKR